MSDWLTAGETAPDFELKDTLGQTVRLSDFRGHAVVLYFYPKDDTPGCTKEACAFRDVKQALVEKKATVLGVSADGQASHERFVAKYDLNFTLLSDPGHEVAQQFGAWRELTRYGKTAMGLQRSTFIIDSEGIIRKAWKSVQVDGHEVAVLEALDKLS